MSAPASRATKRQSQIITLLRQSGRVAVEDLAAHFSVALQTIRRDLNELSEAGQVVRVHGGAIVASGVENLAYEARQLVAHDQKRLIGEAAARLIPDNSSLFINIGTTTEEVAKALSRHSGLLVITNNLHVASELHRSRAIEIFLTGGTVRQSDGGIVGAITVEQIEQFRVDFAVIGTSAIDQTGTLLISTFARWQYRAPSSSMRVKSSWSPTAASSRGLRRCASRIFRRSTSSSPTASLPRRSSSFASDAR